MKTTPALRKLEVVRERIGNCFVCATAGTGAVQVLLRADGSPLAPRVQFGAGPRKRPSPRGLSGGPG